jgi:tetratricopeptide (TPR) repeat protein
MREKITAMLESGDETQILLALQLLKGGGVHASHLTYMLALSRWQNYEWEAKTSIRMQAKLLFNKYASPELVAQQRQNNLKTRREIEQDIYHDENIFHTYINEYAEKVGVEASVLAVMGLLTIKLGALYLLQNNTRPAGWILSNMLKNDMHTNMVLRSFHLTTLPTEIGDFPQIRFLDITGNPLEDVPDSLRNLTNINSLAFDYEKISPLVLEKLMRFFPVLMSNILFSLGTKAKKKVGTNIYPQPNPHPAYLEAIPFFEKGAICQPDYAELWHNVGACWVFYGEPEKALPALHKARDLYEDRLKKNVNKLLTTIDVGYNIFWLSCVYTLTGEKEKGLEYLQELVKRGERYYLKQARSEEDWQMFHQDEDFLAVCNSL